MKILISANVLFTVINFRKDLINFFIEKGYEVVCVANTDNLSTDYDTIIKELKIKFIKINLDRKGINPIKDLSYMYNLVKIYRGERPDIIMHFTIKPNIYGTIASKIAGIPSLNTINGLGSAIIKENTLSKILKYLYKFSLMFSTKVFFQNNDDLNFFVLNNLINIKKTSIVPGSGVNTSIFEKYNTGNKQMTFMLVSRLLKDKGIYEYIDAIKLFRKTNKNCVFLLGGQFDFDNPSSIQRKEVAEWEKEKIIKYVGQTDNIKNFFKISDVIVLPSYREGLSRLLIEAASSSKPIITTNVAGCKDVVKDEYNGYLCNVKDASSLSQCIEKMSKLSKLELDTMGKLSNKIAKTKFDKDIVNKIYFKEVTKVCIT